MTYQIKRYVDGTLTEKSPNHLPPINNPSVLKIIDHAIERNNLLHEQTVAARDISFQNKA